MPWLLGLAGLVAAGFALSRWVRRRLNEVDDYYEREYADPPIFDAGSWLGGDRGF
ncbi:MAG TPA: hypothetical protein VF083_01475 [Acidimicrobiia bacterium]